MSVGENATVVPVGASKPSGLYTYELMVAVYT